MTTSHLEQLWARALTASTTSLELYESLANELVKEWRAGDQQARMAITRRHPILSNIFNSKADSMAFKLEDARLVLAREQHFENWAKLQEHLEVLKDGSSSKFEAAVDAVINGDTETLEKLQAESPELIRQRSTRTHRATLLHYVGANGVEDYRQRTPHNALEVLQVLLRAGAEVDATAAMYGGGSTTLGLVATSIHPKRAGVQLELMQALIDAGAAVDGGSGGGRAAVTGCLANGRPEAATFLAQRGAELNLEGAAGVGRLDLVKSFFNEEGGLKPSATRGEMERGFMWACEFGRNDVVEFLLANGADIRAGENTDLTGLHWAVVGGQLDTIKLLLECGAPLEALNAYGGTVLDQALWCAYNGDDGIDYAPVVNTLLAAGARTDLYPEMKTYVEKVLGHETRTP